MIVINLNLASCSSTRIEAITLSLSLTVGRVEFPIAACSGSQSSFNKRNISSVLRSDILLRFNYYHISINLLDALLLADYNYLLKKALMTSELLSPITSTISDHETPVT